MKLMAKCDFLQAQIKELRNRLITMETLYYTSLNVQDIEHDYGILDWLSGDSSEEGDYPIPTAPPVDEHVYEEAAADIPDLNVVPGPVPGAGGALQ